ncbi:MAG: polysaccharide biosynthesis/export family protein, partial [Tidjanibacter sp.]|nr:polysaccharide biosynthesis/export family protein [Tidjanibacter sp.]
MFKKIVMSLLVAFALISCGSHTDLAYFQEIVESGALESVSGQVNTIQAGDVLTISVSSSNPELAVPYNLFAARSQVGNVSNSSSRVVANVNAEGYTVDAEGNIQFPVLGEIRVAGLTRAEIA